LSPRPRCGGGSSGGVRRGRAAPARRGRPAPPVPGGGREPPGRLPGGWRRPPGFRHGVHVQGTRARQGRQQGSASKAAGGRATTTMAQPHQYRPSRAAHQQDDGHPVTGPVRRHSARAVAGPVRTSCRRVLFTCRRLHPRAGLVSPRLTCRIRPPRRAAHPRTCRGQAHLDRRVGRAVSMVEEMPGQVNRLRPYFPHPW